MFSSNILITNLNIVVVSQQKFLFRTPSCLSSSVSVYISMKKTKHFVYVHQLIHHEKFVFVYFHNSNLEDTEGREGGGGGGVTIPFPTRNFSKIPVPVGFLLKIPVEVIKIPVNKK